MLRNCTLSFIEKARKALLILFLSPLAVFSQNWTGAAGVDWNSPLNWSSWPLNGQDVVIDPALYIVPGNHPQVNANSVFTPANIVVQNGGQMLIGANLQTEEDFEILGAGTQVTMTGGTITIGPGNGGRLTCDLGGSMTINGGTVQVDERLISGEDALIIVNEANVSTGERLLLDLGGHFIQNSGTITVGVVFALADGNANGSCLFEKHGGTLVVNGEMALENEAGNFEPTFIMDGGVFTMNGPVSWFGEAPGSGRPRFIATGGQLQINGNIENLPGSTVRLHMEINQLCDATFNGGTLALTFADDSLIQGNNNALHLQNMAIANDGVVFCENSTTEFSGTNLLSGAGTSIFSSIIIHPGATFANAAVSGIQLRNDLENNGTMNNGTSPVQINGHLIQQLTGSSATTFYDLFVDQPTGAGVSAFEDITIGHHLQLDSGIINMQDGHQVVMPDNATANMGNAASFISGSLQKTGDDAFVFPVGRNNRWMPFGISAPASTAAQVTVAYVDDGYADLVPVVPPLTAVSPVEYWSVQESVDAGPVTVELYWQNADTSGITSCPETTVAEWNGTGWNAIPSVVTGDCSGPGAGTVVSASPVNLETAYTFGFFGNVMSQDTTICAGDSLQVNGNYYSQTGTYIDLLTGTGGSDSTIITHLEVAEPVAYSQDIHLCSGDSILVGTNYYSLAGTYVDILASSAGCDSVVTTTISVGALPDVVITVSGVTLLTTPGYTAYAWVNCGNGSIIPGATSYFFTPDTDGDYAAIITDSLCTDTTNCVTVSGVGITELTEKGLSFYPNPTDGTITFRLNANEQHDIAIYSIDGELVHARQIAGSGTFQLPEELENGTYLLLIVHDGMLISREILILNKGY